MIQVDKQVENTKSDSNQMIFMGKAKPKPAPKQDQKKKKDKKK